MKQKKIINKPFAIVSTHFLSNLGDGISVVVFTLIAAQLTTSSFELGFVISALGFPWLIFSIFSGLIIDKMGVFWVASRAQTLRISVLILLVIFSLFFSLNIWCLMVAAFFLGVSEVFFDNSIPVLLPLVVEKEKLEKMNGVISSSEIVTNRFIGVNLGVLFLKFSNTLSFIINCVVYSFSLSCLYQVQGDFSRKKNTLKKGELGLRKIVIDTVRNVRILWGKRDMQALAFIAFIWNLAEGAEISFLIFYVKEHLGQSETFYGILLGSAAVGGIIGGLFVDKMIKRFGRNTVFFIALLLFPLQFFIRGFVVHGYVAVFSLCVSGFSSILLNTISLSYRQKFIEKSQLGQMNSVIRFYALGAFPLGSLLGGLLADKIGYLNSFFALTFLCLANLLIYFFLIGTKKLNQL